MKTNISILLFLLVAFIILVINFAAEMLGKKTNITSTVLFCFSLLAAGFLLIFLFLI